MIGLLALSAETQCLVGRELAAHAVHGGKDGGSQNNTERDQLWGNLLEGSQALGDGVCCGDVSRRDRGGTEAVRTRLFFLLLNCQQDSSHSGQHGELHTGTEKRFGVDLKPRTGCMRTIGIARERSMTVGADWARSALAARKRVDCMASGWM